MNRPRIFLSHSSSPCAQAGCDCRDYLLALEDHLRDRGCEPVVDRHVLAGGHEWNPTVLRHVKNCHGLILLLSPHALGSFYVLQEVTVAIAEHAANGHYLVLPVLLPGVRRRHLDGSMLEKLNLGRFDMVDWPADAGPTAPPARLDRTIGPLVERLGGVRHPEVTDYVAGRLTEVSDAALARTAGILGLATLAYATDHTRHLVAQGLLTERPVDSFGDPCALRLALAHVLPQVRTPEHRADIVDLVVPFARVPRDDAELLRRLVHDGGDRVVLLRAALSETPHLYIRRAGETPDSWVVRTAAPRPDGTGFAESLVAAVRDLLYEEIAMGMPCDAETLRRLLARHESESGPFTVVLHQRPDPSLVRALLTEFPRLLFLFAHQAQPAADISGGPLALRGMTHEQELDMVGTHRRFRA
ncbi:toll/interleukin-1 receptor domain-containing protein [Streptomyces yaizuensis]|uniref:Toll/interleukin-1 receptor domain-containing protein n=1 Tax=Streptomyces yaizuensis TaxID=2989713 RepID=A0ABQ5P5Q5_9ACTN|nr:toll/interleukin-1 receptor domain-containing protein [Streptomyces sp. YSPA8]GLF97924.1 toll/interleukin-1 receptor domain-containing protein [Streptomyces sp. YSPA8]